MTRAITGALEYQYSEMQVPVLAITDDKIKKEKEKSTTVKPWYSEYGYNELPDIHYVTSYKAIFVSCGLLQQSLTADEL